MNPPIDDSQTSPADGSSPAEPQTPPKPATEPAAPDAPATSVEAPVAGDPPASPPADDAATPPAVDPNQPPANPAGDPPAADDPPADPAAPQEKDAKFWKNKFKQSQAGAMVLNDKVKQMTSKEIPEPTEIEMQALYGEDWDDMNESQKKQSIRQEKSTRTSEAYSTAFNSFVSVQDREIQLSSLISASDELVKYEAEFREFVDKPANKRASAEVLAAAFLHTMSDPAEPATPAAPAEPARAGLESPTTGAPADSPKTDVAALEKLRYNNPREFAKHLKRVMAAKNKGG